MIETCNFWMGNLRELIGKTVKRNDVILKIGSVSVRNCGTVYIHPGEPDTFGWTFLTPSGQLAGDWHIVGEIPENQD